MRKTNKFKSRFPQRLHVIPFFNQSFFIENKKVFIRASDQSFFFTRKSSCKYLTLIKKTGSTLMKMEDQVRPFTKVKDIGFIYINKSI